MELLVVSAMILILASLGACVWVAATNAAREQSCISNLHQLGLALSMYRDDHAGRVPARLAELAPSYASYDVLICPNDDYGGYFNALINIVGRGDPYTLAKADFSAPTSYWYAGAFFPEGWPARLSRSEHSAYLVCSSHGKTRYTWDGLPLLSGRTARLHFDGSVSVESIDSLTPPNPELSLGPSINFMAFFKPDQGETP